MQKVRLNLGCGPNPIEGYDNSFDITAEGGKPAFPLEIPDQSVDEIRASHLLEHFGHKDALKVVRNWVAKLKPGGLLKIAVPDFEVIASMFLDGKPGQYQEWLGGGQIDRYDAHLTQYDWHGLSNLLRAAGLIGVHTWRGEGDCSAYPISLNLAAYKPLEKWPTVMGVMSRPRLGWQDHFGCAMEHLLPLGIPVLSRTGVYWGKCMTIALDSAIMSNAEWILTLDYDTLFHRNDIEDLLAYMAAHPEADAIMPMQMGRTEKILLNPAPNTTISLSDELCEVQTGHFGCTMIRTSALLKMPKPWFRHSYQDDGEHKYDEDINFWLQFQQAGNRLFVAPRVVVGHLEVFAMWPNRQLGIEYQKTTDWRDNGRPKNCFR